MQTMHWLALLSLFVITFADENITSIPFVIPGADFVGYGFDIRYLQTEHALRFPLVDWTYATARTYVYPLNRDDVYLVPDQLFVRTVARTDAESYVFSTLDQFRTIESESHGVNANATGDFDPLQFMPLENRTQVAYNLSLFESNVRQQYPQAKLISPKVRFESKMFTLGSEATNAKTSLSKSENFYVRNKQVNQLYQLFLDKRPLRQTLEKDMMGLFDQTWASDPEGYRNFFERYGTHVVVSAMLGGAISLDSVVQKTAIQTIDSSVSNFTQNTTSVHIDQNNVTVTDTLERDSSRCNGTFAGYGYNPFKGRCELLPETFCYNAMAKGDEYNDLFPSNRTWTVGPNIPPDRPLVENCIYWEACWGYWFWERCEWRSSCWWVYVGTYQYPWNYWDPVASTPIRSCPLCGGSLVVDNSGLPYERIRIGQYKDFPNQPSPQLFTFHAKLIDTFPGVHGVVELVDTRDKANPNDDITILRFAQEGAFFGFYPFTNPIRVDVSGEWKEIRIVMNYTDLSADLWYNKSGSLILGEKGRKFDNQNVQGNRIGRINLYSPSSGSSDSYSGFSFCNPTNGPPYKSLTTHMAVTTTTAKFKQVVSGKVDTSYENTYNKYTLYQSNNWKLKGGDSSMVDLLNFRQSTDVFEAWKVTIQSNPAPVQFTLKEISQFFPDVITSFNVSQREFVRKAIESYLREESIIDPIFNTNLNETIIA